VCSLLSPSTFAIPAYYSGPLPPVTLPTVPSCPYACPSSWICSFVIMLLVVNSHESTDLSISCRLLQPSWPPHVTQMFHLQPCIPSASTNIHAHPIAVTESNPSINTAVTTTLAVKVPKNVPICCYVPMADILKRPATPSPIHTHTHINSTAPPHCPHCLQFLHNHQHWPFPNVKQSRILEHPRRKLTNRQKQKHYLATCMSRHRQRATPIKTSLLRGR
jgi:hypothetical protein